MNCTKGGRGKKAPYETEMYRIPSGIKTLIQFLAERWKETNVLYDPEATMRFVKAVYEAIEVSFNRVQDEQFIDAVQAQEPTETEDVHAKQLSEARVLLHVYKQASKDTRNWVEAKRLINDLEKIIGIADLD